ncbi:MAG: hypothetical protein FWC71_09980 [Defluviitaleaceae bacterium]|nr:hypothetical protein [Defluviitaleaceae bacterium]
MRLVYVNDPFLYLDLIQVTHSPAILPVQAPPTTTAPATPPPPTTPTPIDRPAITFPEHLVGIWRYDFNDYDEFFADGTGLVLGANVLWGAVDGIFLVCFTPYWCEIIFNCDSRDEWYYENIGDRIYLTCRFDPTDVIYFTMVDYKYTLVTTPQWTPILRDDITFPDEFVGAWTFAEGYYLIFNADGTGRDGPLDKLWGVVDNVILLCFTPLDCQTICACWLPTELYFVIEGDTLTYINRFAPTVYMVMTRVDYMPELTTPPIPEALTITDALIGTWYWLDIAWYILNADGTGTMNGADIAWGTYGGVLFVCTTPFSCLTIEACWAPAQWYYEFVDGQLRLTSRVLEPILSRVIS